MSGRVVWILCHCVESIKMQQSVLHLNRILELDPRSQQKVYLQMGVSCPTMAHIMEQATM